MKRYPEYKESEFQWIGHIPAHWETKPVWMMFHLGRGRVISNEEIGDNPGQYPVYSSQTESDGIMGYIDTYDFDGDYITWTTDGAKAGTVFCRTGKFNCTNVCGTLSPNSYDVNLKFFGHALNIVTSRFVRQDINPKLMNNVMAKIRVQVPPLTEQTQIANFLNHKTGQIDELIRVKERKIELLTEYRASLINQAVTKGLDPNVEMKTSGLEWITEVPKHWEVLKVKHVSSSNPSKNNPRTKSFKDEPVVFLPMERVHTDGTIDQALKLPYSQLKTGYTYFEENDVLVAKVTPCFENGKIVLIKDLATPVGFGSTEFIVIRPNVEKVFPLFLYYVLYNYPLRSIGKHFMTSAVGLKRVPTEFVRNFQIPIPSYQEQMQIVNFLDRKTKQIDELRSNEEQSIKLLKEYRQSLISEVVTGKIDVRNEV